MMLTSERVISGSLTAIGHISGSVSPIRTITGSLQIGGSEKIYARDDGDGNITLFGNITVIDDGDGNVSF